MNGSTNRTATESYNLLSQFTVKIMEESCKER